jgi:Zn-dependent peptidase ImmA (M78 family)
LPTAVVSASDATDDERASIQVALTMWQQVDGPNLSLQADQMDPGLQILRVGFERASLAAFGRYRPEYADVLINRNLLDPRGRAITIAHEIGHAFRLSHTKGRRSLMNPGNLDVPPAPEEAQLIRTRRGPCPATSAL